MGRLRTLIRPRTKTTATTTTTTTASTSKVTTSNGTKFVLGGWTFFLLENVLLSENREWICSEYGEDKYHLGYNTLSTTACLSILFGFIKYKGTGPRWSTFVKGAAPPALRIGAVVLQSFGLACFAQLIPAVQIPVALVTGDEQDQATSSAAKAPSPEVRSDRMIGPNRSTSGTPTSTPPPRFAFKARCPMDFRSKPELPPDAVYGVERITRHHNLWALASLGVGTALITPFLVEATFFGGPLLLASLGTTHQDSRFRRGMGGTLSPAKEQATSNIPFGALLFGQQDWMKLFDEIKWLNCGIASLIVVAGHVR